MIYIQKKTIIAIFLLCLVSASQAADSDCIKTGPNGLCILCNHGKVAFNGKCIESILHCLQFSVNDECTKCELGYVLDNFKKCNMQKISFQLLTANQISMDQDLKKIQDAVRLHQTEMPASTQVYKIYKFTDSNNVYYRIVYELPNGYSEILAEFNKATNRISMQSYQAYITDSAEKVINIENDPLGPELYKQLFLSYPELQGQDLLKSYFKYVGGISFYRFLFLISNRGIVEIQITLAPRFSQTQISFIQLSLLNTTKQYKAGYKYFLSKYSDTLGGGSTPQQIGSIVIDGTTFYIIFIRSGTTLYQALYTLSQDGSVKFDQLSPLEELRDIIIPDPTTFVDMGIDIFKADINYQAIFRYINQVRSNTVKQNQLTKVSISKTSEYWFYQLIFTIKGGIYQFIIAVLPSVQQVYIVYQNTNVDQIDGGSTLVQFTPTEEQLLADGLVRNSYPQLFGAQLIRVQRQPSTNPNYQLYQYSYQNFDMMWIFYVRKNNKGQYQVSRTPLPEQPQPGSMYEMTKDEIDNDFNIAIISRKIMKDFSSVLGKNPKIVKVMHQVTNQLIYVITFETQQKSQVTYRAVLDQNTNVDVVKLGSTAAPVVTPVADPTPVVITPTPVPEKVVNKDPAIIDLSTQKAIQIIIDTYTDLLGQKYDVVTSNSKVIYGITIYQVIIRTSNGRIFRFTLAQKLKAAQMTISQIEQFIVTPDTPVSGSIAVLEIYINTNTNRFQYLEEIPKDKIDTDATIKQINNRVQAIYATKFGKFATLNKVYKKTSDKGENYYLYYTTEKGLFYVVVVVKNDNNLDVQTVDSWVANRNQGKNDDKTKQVEDTRVPLTGAPQSLSKAQYLADPNFVNIDNKLKREANLAGYEVVEVTRQLVNGNIYTITYKNSNGVTIIYRVYISFSGDIQVQNTTTTGQDQAQPKPQEQVPPMPGAPQSLSKAQYLADPNFVNIDNKLKREANLAGYEVVEVTRQLVNGNIYTITYKNSNGVTIIYRVYISFSGDIQVQNTTTTGQDQAQPKPQEQVPPMPGAPQSLSKAQYLADPNFVNIDNKLKREANLAGYEVVEVTRQLVNGNIYTITYKNSNGVTIIYRVYISFSGDIQVQNTTTTGQDQAQPKPQEQVPPMPGAPQSLSKAQYLADPNFVNIDNKLKREANLAGYEVVEVTRQLVNGNIYTITYKNSNGVTIIYRVYISFSGDIQVQNTTTTGQDQAQPKPQEQVPPMPGAPQSLSKAQYLADPNFVNIDNKLKREANLAGYEVVEVTRQLVNGNIYTITYKNSNGVTIIYRVYISFSGDIQVQNTTTTGQDQAQPKPQEQVPPMPGAPQSLSKAQYLADPNFVNIDNKLKREANLAGYEVVEVTRQLVNGNIYTITYKNSNGVTIIYRVYISFSGDIQVQNTTTTGQDQAQPKPQEQVPPMPGAPQSLSKAQYLADPNFVNIDNKLKREANLAGYEVVEVTRQLVNGNIYTITYKNSNGVTIIYRVYISFSGDIQVQNTIGNPPPKVQAEKNPIPVTTSPSAPPSIVPFELLRMVQTETFTPFSSFSTTFINLAAFANKLITQYAPIFKSFQFVIYNSSSNIYKFITSNWIDFIVTSNGSSDYVLDQIIDLNTRISQPSYILPQNEYSLIVQVVGIFKVKDIQTISGFKFSSSDQLFQSFDLTVVLKSGVKYILRLIKYVKVDGNPYRLLELIQNFNNNKTKFVFAQEPGTLDDGPNILRKLNIPIQGLLPESIAVQSQNSSQDILRVTFKIKLSGYAERVEVLYNKAKRQVYSIRYMDYRFAEIDPDIITGLNSGRNDNEFMSRLAVSQLVQVIAFLRNLDQFKNSQVKVALVRQYGLVFEYQIYLQGRNQGYRIRATRRETQQIYITSMNRIEVQNLNEGVYVYAATKTALPVNMEKTKKQRSFAISVATLMRGYSHFLVSPQIRDILAIENYEAQTITYSIIFDTMNGVFLGILDYSTVSQTAIIRALVLIEANDLRRVLRGCIEEQPQSNKCQACQEKFYLNENGFCYDKVKYCRTYIGDACVLCENPFVLNSYGDCVANCGFLCTK